MKLLTKAIERDLVKAAEGAHQYNEHSKIVVKFFTPDGAASWYILEGAKEANGDWRLFGWCDLGDSDMAELGYVMLSDLQSIRGIFGLPVERDKWYSGTLGNATGKQS